MRVGQKEFPVAWATESADDFRKAYIAFVGLNALVTIHYGTKNGLLPEDYRANNFDEILKAWMEDDQIFSLTQNRGYPSEFRDLCKAVRARIQASPPNSK